MAGYGDLPKEVRYDLDIIFGWTGEPKKVTLDGREVAYSCNSSGPGKNIQLKCAVKAVRLCWIGK